MTTGITLQSQAPGAAGADLGFWLGAQIAGQPMAMTEAGHLQLIEAISANRFSLPRNRKTGARITDKGTAIVEVHGILLDRAPILGTFWGLTAYEGLAEQFRRLATHDEVKRIVLDIDSPGGLVRGLSGCSEALETLAEKKPVHAIAHNQCCSAAYWLGCVAETLSVTSGGEVGSIGVRAGHISYAEALERDGVRVTILSAGATKADGSPFSLLSDGEFAERKFDIERSYDRFVAHVAHHRGIKTDAVRDTDARCFSSETAIASGLADRVESLEDMIERLEKSATRTPRRKRGKTDSGSKAGKAPPERLPAEPDEDEPTAGLANPRGAMLMSHQDLAAKIAAALTDMQTAEKPADKAAPAPAAPAAAAAAAPAQPSVDVVKAAVDAALARVFAVLESDEGKARPKLALALAKSGIGADAAKGIMAATAAEEPAAKADDKPEDKDAKALGDALARQMAKPGSAAGVKPDKPSASAARKSFVEVAEATAKKK